MINPYFLKYFYDAVVEQSVLRASEKNAISPTAISSAIKKVEDYYEVSLLEHKKNNFNLTEDGQKLFESVPQIFEVYQKIEAIFGEHNEQLSGKIRLATTYSVATSILPDFIELFQKKYPNIALEIKMAEHGMIKYWIDKGLVNIGLTVLRNDRSNKFKTIEVESGTFKIVKRKGTRPKKFVVAGDWPEVLDLKKKYKKRNSTKLPILLDAPSWIFAREFILGGSGMALLPSYLLTEELSAVDQGFDLMDYSMSFLHKKERILSRSEQTFIDELKKHRS